VQEAERRSKTMPPGYKHSQGFNKNPSETYTKAVEALRLLLEEEGGDHVERAFAQTICDLRYDRYAEQHGKKADDGMTINESPLATFHPGDHSIDLTTKF
jgi:hypothetical protein